jgi:hypothetical protein
MNHENNNTNINQEEDEHNKENTNPLSYKIAELENEHAIHVLPDGLKELYAEVQLDCDDFRNNVFFKNLDIIEASLVIKYL